MRLPFSILRQNVIRLLSLYTFKLSVCLSPISPSTALTQPLSSLLPGFLFQRSSSSNGLLLPGVFFLFQWSFSYSNGLLLLPVVLFFHWSSFYNGLLHPLVFLVCGACRGKKSRPHTHQHTRWQPLSTCYCPREGEVSTRLLHGAPHNQEVLTVCAARC